MALRLGVIGAGAMGALHTRVITDAPDVDLSWVADPDELALDRARSRYGAATRTDPGSLNDVDAIVIATPTNTHRDWCLRAIEAGVPFLVEKPLSGSIEDVSTVCSAATAAAIPFTVGFVERFNPAVRTIEGIIDDPVYFSAIRHSPYVERIRTGVSGDLMIHDIDLALRLMQSDPNSISASFAFVHPSSETDAEDIAEAHIRFDDGSIAALSASRTAQRKIRTLTVAGLDLAAEIDLIRQDVTIYRHVLSRPIDEDRPGYRQETIMEIPQLQHRFEPLVAQLAHFRGLVEGTVDPTVEAAGVLAPHRLLAAAERSAMDGRAVTMDDV